MDIGNGAENAITQLSTLKKGDIMEKYDVGIVGVWQGCNYGSMMTYYALNRAVQSMGKSVLMIDKPLNREARPI